MNVLIDNKNLKDYYQIEVLDYTPAFGIASEREDQRVWSIKSGVDKNKENIRYDAKDFVMKCYCKASNEVAAYNIAKTLTDYMFEKGVFVLSFRDSAKSIRECFLCERSSSIVPNIHVREQNGVYYFKLGFKDINPNALIFKTIISAGLASVNYTKGLVADIYWGDGRRGEVSNSGGYTQSYPEDGEIDIIVDVDKNLPDILSLEADFVADEVSGIKDFTVHFSDLSSGDVVIWSWNFGDGSTSNLQNPTHIYTEPGTFTVTLQVFNSAQGSDVETKISYITVRNARMLVSDSSDFALKNNTDYGIIN